MRPFPEQRPSWLSTALFALLAFVILGIAGGIYGAGYEDTRLRSFEDPDSPPFREYFVTSVALVAASTGAAIAAWAWRAPRQRRFHIAYLSGVVLLIAAFWDLQQSRRGFDRINELALTWDVMQLLLEGLILAWFTATLGLVLILVALIQDRR